jgi:hypothetical protein
MRVMMHADGLARYVPAGLADYQTGGAMAMWSDDYEEEIAREGAVAHPAELWQDELRTRSTEHTERATKHEVSTVGMTSATTDNFKLELQLSGCVSVKDTECQLLPD